MLFSPVGILEVAIKAALRRRDFLFRPGAFIGYAAEMDALELLVTSSTAARVVDLPMHQRDPFDRLLIAQAIDEGALLLTADAALTAHAPYIVAMA